MTASSLKRISFIEISHFSLNFMKYKMKNLSIVFAVITTIIFSMTTQILAETATSTTEYETSPPVSMRPIDRRPSFWTKTANELKASTYLRNHRPYANHTLLYRKFWTPLEDKNIKVESTNLFQQRPRRRRIKIKIEPKQNIILKPTTDQPVESETEDFEDKLMKDESFIQFKEFVKEFINETTKYFTKKKNSISRSYPMEEPPTQHHQLWDDKDQTYHASSFTNAEYEPTSFHHHFIPPHPIHYYPPQKKDDHLLTKVALIALFKLILAKLKAIGFLKLMMFLMMNMPFLFLKFIFILKGFKILKLLSFPLLMACFALPFAPLFPLFAPLVLLPLLFAPVFLPLMLPLLFFLPIVPVTTPSTASASKEKRSVNSDWSLMDEKWKDYQTNNNTNWRRFYKDRIRPASVENIKRGFNYNLTESGKLERYEDTSENSNLLEITQRVVESQRCMERVACELARQNDSKIYHAAVTWALEKVIGIAPDKIKRKIEKYLEAYENGATKKSSQYCQQKFACQRPRVVVVQGQAKYSIF